MKKKKNTYLVFLFLTKSTMIYSYQLNSRGHSACGAAPPEKTRVGPCRRHDATRLVLDEILDARMNRAIFIITVIPRVKTRWKINISNHVCCMKPICTIHRGPCKYSSYPTCNIVYIDICFKTTYFVNHCCSNIGSCICFTSDVLCAETTKKYTLVIGDTEVPVFSAVSVPDCIK